MKVLERRLGLLAVSSISMSAMLGSGIFVLPGVAVTYAGTSLWLAYLLAAVAVLPAALSKSELATAMPTSGGTYVYLDRTFGPLIGTVAGLGLWLSLLLKSAFALIGFGAYLKVLAPQAELIPTCLSVLAFIGVINILGVGKVSTLLIIAVSVSIAFLAILCGLAIPQGDFSIPLSPPSTGWEGLMAGTALVFVSYAGVTKVAAIAEEIDRPEDNLPRGILMSLLIVTLLYTLSTFVLVANFPVEQLSGNLRPIDLLARKIGGHPLEITCAIIAVVTMSSMANSGILAAARFPFAMGRDRLLPSKIGNLHDRFLTPVNAIVISTLVVGGMVLSLDVAKMAKFASVFILMIYMSENVAVIVLRETRVQWYRPTYKSIFYPATQIVGIFLPAILLVGMGVAFTGLALAIIVVPGILLYFFYSRRRIKRRGLIGIRGRRQDLVGSESETSKQTFRWIDFSKSANAVVALFGKERSPEMLIEMGAALAERGGVEVTHITELPEQTDLGDIREETVVVRSLRRRISSMAAEREEDITFDPVVSHDLSKTIYHISQRFHCHWLLMEWSGRSSGGLTFHNPVGWLKDHLECNLGIFKNVGVRYIRHILVYLRKGHDDKLTISTADHLAGVYRAKITLLKHLPPNITEEEEESARLALNAKAETCSHRAEIEIVKSSSEAQTIVKQTVKFDLLVFNAGPNSIWNSIRGTHDDYWMENSACSVLSVQSAQNRARSLEGGLGSLGY